MLSIQDKIKRLLKLENCTLWVLAGRMGVDFNHLTNVMLGWGEIELTTLSRFNRFLIGKRYCSDCLERLRLCGCRKNDRV